jgi:hypothetical protein
MRVAGEEHLAHRSLPINNKYTRSFAFPVIFCNLTAMDIENDQIINSAEVDAAIDSTYVVVSIIFIFLFGLGLCALEGSFINYDLAIGRFDFRPLGV